jgi:hypothetical protein
MPDRIEGPPKEAEFDEFERQVTAPQRRIGWVIAGLALVGLAVGVFLRVQASLGHEQWSSAGSAVSWGGLIAIATLFGRPRNRSGPAAIDSMSRGSTLPAGAAVFAALLVAMACAAVDCGLAPGVVRGAHEVYPAVIQLRRDADRGLVLFGIVLVAVLRWR